MGNFSRFFIDRPIFASVLAIVITIAGVIAGFSLPIAQYPEISPPTVTITTSYPGASAETIAATVAAPIEQQLSGAEGMLYFTSTAGSDGTLTITATFEVGTDVDRATFQLNNRVQTALPQLPDEVRRNGVIVAKRSNDILLVIGLFSPNGTQATTTMADYANVNIIDDLKRIPGVGDVLLFGSGSSMRVWLHPDKMAQLGVTATDVENAISAQNAQYAAGKVGAEPAPKGQDLTYTVTVRGRLSRVDEFENVIVRANGPNGVLRLKDVASVELGAQQYDTPATVDGKPSVGMAVFLQTGANALQVGDAIKARLVEMDKAFPPDMKYLIPFDTTIVVRASIHEVEKTIFEAALLVLAVVFIFLQTWRATIIPMLAVPVSIIGTFAGLFLLGFTINTLTLFAMVLAIGIVVDDAIVVLENVERLMREHKMRPHEAAIEAMREVSGALIAIILVLCAVFIPVAFLGGLAGQLYKQFAVTVAVAVVISGFTALTLTPALCSLLLKPGDHDSRIFRPFNKGFAKLTATFLYFVNSALRRRLVAWLAFVVVLVALGALFYLVPRSFIPPEDQGYLISSILLPDGASLQRTQKTGAQLQQILSKDDAVAHAFVAAGRDFIGGGNKPNAGTSFILLKNWDERTRTAPQIAGELMGQGMRLPDGLALVFNPPAIRGLGSAGGFEFYVQSRGDSDPRRLGTVVQSLVQAMQADPMLTGINTFFRPTVPQFRVEVNREQAMSLGVPVNDVFSTLGATLGAFYVNDFNLGGRTYRVQVQADAPYRASPEKIGSIFVRSQTTSEMIPLKALVRIEPFIGAEQVDRFNGFIAAKVLGNGKPGVSSGQAIQEVEKLAGQVLPAGYTLAWSGQAFQELRTGNASVFAFGLAIIMVYLILSALYERWRLPAAVVLAVPFAVLGALGLVWLRGMENDIYFQIGLVVLIGLAAKNAILIVEFAQQGLLSGMSAKDAALQAARLRFRPIVMTSLAFVFGVLPLSVATGAGAAARRSMGTGVVGGMMLATFVATIFIPLFFTVFARRQKMGQAAQEENREPMPPDEHGAKGAAE
ncbi:MAG TPA: multidrug efflux RND transporter permease subunit [Usitatibacter sp.]|jgi:HAE1 family hydrophobic/amphiphilic exporter-1/multidrug efflux pump|nr:multidrug efflux RND transporter permease subunit [Usitatibacter sp.]